jgi:hypothetical protein
MIPDSHFASALSAAKAAVRSTRQSEPAGLDTRPMEERRADLLDQITEAVEAAGDPDLQLRWYLDRPEHSGFSQRRDYIQLPPPKYLKGSSRVYRLPEADWQTLEHAVLAHLDVRSPQPAKGEDYVEPSDFDTALSPAARAVWMIEVLTSRTVNERGGAELVLASDNYFDELAEILWLIAAQTDAHERRTEIDRIRLLLCTQCNPNLRHHVLIRDLPARLEAITKRRIELAPQRLQLEEEAKGSEPDDL